MRYMFVVKCLPESYFQSENDMNKYRNTSCIFFSLPPVLSELF